MKITGEFYLQTVEGAPNYNIHRWLESEGAEVYPASITIWLDYLLRLAGQEFEDHIAITKHALWIEKGQWEAKARDGSKGLIKDPDDLATFITRYGAGSAPLLPARDDARRDRPVLVGCDFGSTTAKAVVLSIDCELLSSCYAPSMGNPIEDAKALFRQVREAGFGTIGALAITGYGKDLLTDIVGAASSAFSSRTPARSPPVSRPQATHWDRVWMD